MPEILQRLQASLHVGDRGAERTEARSLSQLRDVAVDPSAVHVVRVEAHFGGYWAVCACRARSLECDRPGDAARWVCPIGEGERIAAIADRQWRERNLEAQMHGVVR